MHAGSWDESKDAAFLRRWREHNDEEDEEDDGESETIGEAEADNNSLESILSEILSSSCSLLPLCFSPLIMVTRLVAEDRDKSDSTLLPEALELYWHLHQRPALMFSLTSGRDFLLENCAREGSCHFFCDRLPECNLRLFGWEQIKSINSFISDKLRSLSV